MVNIACIKFAFLHTEFVKLLAIDRGNSRTKVALRNENGDLSVNVFANNEDANILLFIQSLDFNASIMSSVATSGIPALVPHLSKQKFVELNSQTPLPIKNRYTTPETLGADRIAGAVGAWHLAANKNVLLVDAGTCINYECVIDNAYIGGAIAPGLKMRLQAMHTFTGKLPLLELPEEIVDITGDSTKACMLSGAVLGMVNEMEGIARDYMQNYPSLLVVLTGGDAPYLGKYLKNSIFAPHKEVALIGLLEILKYNLNVKS
jgi:type III pantothenate kinase